jgi:Ca2+-binding EF-hand superfamily protein
LFDQLDTNRDGFLSRAEVESLGLPPYNASTPWVLSFQGLDTNRDGFLSRSEAEPLIASTRVSGGRWVVITTAPFDRFDRDRDGFLNRAEAAPLMNGATFDRYDTNRDGFLSKSEAEPFFGSSVGGTSSTYGGTVYGPR